MKYHIHFYFGDQSLFQETGNNLKQLMVYILNILEDSAVGTHAVILNDGKIIQRYRKSIKQG